MNDGSDFECFDTIKGILADDTTEKLTCINKGVVVNTAYIVSMEGNSYTMSDGAVFTGRIKSSQKDLSVIKEKIQKNDNIGNAYSVLKKLPLAFCVIELVFDENGKGLDFIFRYCNSEMEALEGKPIEEMIDHSFYEVFQNGDKKWLIDYADVALNGTSRVIESYSLEIDANSQRNLFINGFVSRD